MRGLLYIEKQSLENFQVDEDQINYLTLLC